MKTHKCRLEIKWETKNSTPDVRPLAIDYTDSKDLKDQLKKIKNQFKTLGECPTYPLGNPENVGKIPFSVKFN